MFFSLKNKIAFITGGCSGIGLAVAKRFLAAGAKVMLTDLQDGDGVAGKIGAEFIKANVTDEEEMKNAF